MAQKRSSLTVVTMIIPVPPLWTLASVVSAVIMKAKVIIGTAVSVGRTITMGIVVVVVVLMSLTVCLQHLYL